MSQLTHPDTKSTGKTTLSPDATTNGPISHPNLFIKLVDPRLDDVPLKVGFFSAVAEFIGTFLFVFFATAVVVAAKYYGQNITLIIAFGQGFALAIAIYLTAPASGGHLNPAVTIATFCVGRISLIRGFMYIVAQYAAATAAAAVTRGIYPDRYTGNLGSTMINDEISLVGAFFLEMIMTFTLVVVMFSTAIDPRGVGKLAPLAIGIVVVIDELIGASFTGGSMNPARTFGPALISNSFDHYWLYFFAPVAGSILAAVMYEQFLQASDAFRGFLPNQKCRTDRQLEKCEKKKQRRQAAMKRHGCKNNEEILEQIRKTLAQTASSDSVASSRSSYDSDTSQLSGVIAA